MRFYHYGIWVLFCLLTVQGKVSQTEKPALSPVSAPSTRAPVDDGSAKPSFRPTLTPTKSPTTISSISPSMTLSDPPSSQPSFNPTVSSYSRLPTAPPSLAASTLAPSTALPTYMPTMPFGGAGFGSPGTVFQPVTVDIGAASRNPSTSSPSLSRQMGPSTFESPSSIVDQPLEGIEAGNSSVLDSPEASVGNSSVLDSPETGIRNSSVLNTTEAGILNSSVLDPPHVAVEGEA